MGFEKQDTGFIGCNFTGGIKQRLNFLCRFEIADYGGQDSVPFRLCDIHGIAWLQYLLYERDTSEPFCQHEVAVGRMARACFKAFVRTFSVISLLVLSLTPSISWLQRVITV